MAEPVVKRDDLIELCEALLAAVRSLHKDSDVTALLGVEAQQLAHFHYRRAIRQEQPHAAALESARHPDQPKPLLLGNADIHFFSEAHVRNIFRAIQRLRRYALRASRGSLAPKPGRPRREMGSILEFKAGKRRALESDIEYAAREVSKLTANDLAESGDIPIKPPPNSLIARKLKVSSQCLNNWRKDPVYRDAFRAGVLIKLADQVKQGLAIEKPAPDQVSRILANPRPYMLSWVSKGSNWPGPTRSPIDNMVYQTPGEYVDHLIANGVILSEVVAEARRPPKRK